MKKWLIGALALLLTVTAAGCKNNDKTVTSKIPTDKDAIVAYVGGDPVTKEEYLFYLRNRLSEVADYVTGDDYIDYLAGPLGEEQIPTGEFIKKMALDDAKQIRIFEQKYNALGYDFNKHSGEKFKAAMKETEGRYESKKRFEEVLSEEGVTLAFFERYERASIMLGTDRKSTRLNSSH